MNRITRTIRARLLALFAAGGLLVAAAALVASSAGEEERVAAVLREKARTLGRLAAGRAAEADDPEAAVEAFRRAALQDPDVAAAWLVDRTERGLPGERAFGTGSARDAKHRRLASLAGDGEPALASTERGVDVAVGLPESAGGRPRALVVSLDGTRHAEAARRALWGRAWTLALVLAAVASAFFLASPFVVSPLLRLLDRAVDKVREVSARVFDAADRLTHSGQRIAGGAAEQSRGLERTSASLRQMSVMTRRNAESARLANEMATEAHGHAEASRESVRRLASAVSGVRQSTESMAKILESIDSVAFQTNLLALNAAVEAARAGEAGRGFAVVAEEVRNLARQSADAARKTSELLRESQQSVEGGTEASQEVEDILARIGNAVQGVRSLAEQVAAASEEQAKGIEDASSAVDRLEAVTREHSSSAGDATSMSEGLFAEAHGLGALLEDLDRALGGPGQGRRGTPAARASRRPPAPGRPPSRVRASPAAGHPSGSRSPAPAEAPARPESATPDAMPQGTGVATESAMDFGTAQGTGPATGAATESAMDFGMEQGTERPAQEAGTATGAATSGSTGASERRPEQVIPLSDAELEDLRS